MEPAHRRCVFAKSEDGDPLRHMASSSALAFHCKLGLRGRRIFLNDSVGGNSGRDNAQRSVADPFPNGFSLPRGSADGLLTQVGLGLNGPWPQAMMTPYNQQWNFTIQRSLGDNTVLEIAYAGNKGTHLAFYTAQMDELDRSI